MDDFCSARTANTAALPWSNFAPPFSMSGVRAEKVCADRRSAISPQRDGEYP